MEYYSNGSIKKTTTIQGVTIKEANFEKNDFPNLICRTSPEHEPAKSYYANGLLKESSISHDRMDHYEFHYQ